VSYEGFCNNRCFTIKIPAVFSIDFQGISRFPILFSQASFHISLPSKFDVFFFFFFFCCFVIDDTRVSNLVGKVSGAK